MHKRPPRPASSAEPARWLTDRVDISGPDWVTNMVGAGFEAYARLLHPLTDEPGGPTWAQVARANDHTMHPSVQWDRIRSPGPFNPDAERSGRAQPGSPIWGRLNTWALEELCAILAGHTSSSRTCYFAVWQGCRLDLERPVFTEYPHGAPRVPPRPAPPEWRLDLSGPSFSLQGRKDYYLFEGHVSEAVRIGRWMTESWFWPQSPHFFWPADHAWCVATDSGADSTVIGGSRDLVNELCGSKDIEVLHIAPDAPYEDRVNR